jgi:hypothetical protein
MAKKKEMDMLIVGSKTKAVIRDAKCMCAGDTLGALNEKLHCILAGAIARAKANKRSTVRPQDL